MKRLGGIAFSIILLAASTAPAAPDTVRIDSGPVKGSVEDAVVTFKGIPFAAPPVGPLRWRAPQPVSPWTEIRDASQYGKACIQPKALDSGDPADMAMSEDCLTLNVVRPDDDRKNLPVLVWIHGGALVVGASSLPEYDGANFARHGLVFVSFNYRLGAFGFFAHPALTHENADDGRLGSYALMDQIAALEWVKRNIAAFGGDPSKVTIFGESAGAFSVDSLMISPPARGLFQAAMVESGYGRGSFTRVTDEAPDNKYPADRDGIALMTAMGYDKPDPTPAELRAVPADKIRATFRYGGERFAPIVDGVVMTEDLWDGFRKSHEAPVPLIIGTNSQEIPPQTDDAMLKRILMPYMAKSEQPKIVALFGGDENFRNYIATDAYYSEQNRALARFHAKNGYPTYLYRFSAVPESVAKTQQGARHGSEIAYVFDNLSAAKNPTGDHDEMLAKTINAYWANLASKGDPNGSGLPVWPRYEEGKEVIMDFTDAGPKAGRDPRAKRLDALSKVMDPRS